MTAGAALHHSPRERPEAVDHPAQVDREHPVELLGGVVNGCRSFARRMVQRGTGGHLVNVSSMAAYAPLQSLSAYCTSKAASSSARRQSENMKDAALDVQ
ncbi:hypothetical protein MAHJHV59_47660 [Mycobacterium avium subsp. hominissuis]